MSDCIIHQGPGVRKIQKILAEFQNGGSTPRCGYSDNRNRCVNPLHFGNIGEAGILNRIQRLSNRFNMTEEAFMRLYNYQKGMCAGCGIPLDISTENLGRIVLKMYGSTNLDIKLFCQCIYKGVYNET
jgi:hypothetical protein